MRNIKFLDPERYWGNENKMLTEQEVSRSWTKLFKAQIDDETFAKAEALLEELRPESPLRHRLGRELGELRTRSLQAN